MDFKAELAATVTEKLIVEIWGTSVAYTAIYRYNADTIQVIVLKQSDHNEATIHFFC